MNRDSEPIGIDIETDLRKQHGQFIRYGNHAHNRKPVGIPMRVLRARRSRRNWNRILNQWEKEIA